MGSDLFVAAAGAAGRLEELDVVANNLANVDTLGFKRDRTLFRTALEASLRDADGHALPGAAGLSFATMAGLVPDYASGPILQTGAPLDAAIRGEGFFVVDTPDGERFTRAGSFTVDAAGALTTADGFAVQGDGGALRVGGRPAEIRASGQLVDDSGAALGRLRVVTFQQPERLQKAGANLFQALPGAEPLDVAAPDLAPGSLERSNVSAIRELTHLIQVQRAFDAAVQTVTRQDRTTERLLQEVGS